MVQTNNILVVRFVFLVFNALTIDWLLIPAIGLDGLVSDISLVHIFHL